jgi:hypothetical protein
MGVLDLVMNGRRRLRQKSECAALTRATHLGPKNMMTIGEGGTILPDGEVPSFNYIHMYMYIYTIPLPYLILI